MDSILIIDDDRNLTTSLCGLLSAAGYKAHSVSSGKEALKEITAAEFPVVILDIVLPDINGKEILGEIKKIRPQSQVIIMTGFPVIEEIKECLGKGAFDYIAKPLNPETFLSRVGRALQYKSFQKTLEAVEIDAAFDVFKNKIRRDILRLLTTKGELRLKTITELLDEPDHPKILHHLDFLKEKGFLGNGDHAYSLTPAGETIARCLKVVDNFFEKES